MGRGRLSVPRVFDFSTQLVISTGTSANQTIGEILLSVIPGSTRAIQANQANDKSGVDWWLEMTSGDFIAVDCKIRDEDPRVKFKADDLALETWSVVEKKVVGWTLDANKKTDYVFWIWKDTGRWCVVPFRLLMKAFQENMDEWKRIYRSARQCTEGRYHSECLFVPRSAVWLGMSKAAAGNSETLRKKVIAEQGTLFEVPA